MRMIPHRRDHGSRGNMTDVRRRDFMGSLALGTGALTVPEFASGREDRPNIVVILVDDQGFGDSSVLPHDMGIAMPNLDRLARGGVTFTQGYSSAPMCNPSRAGLMSGRAPARLGIYNVDTDSAVGLPKGEKIAPEYLKELGYTTAAVGKWHLGGEIDAFRYNYPLSKGFDRFWGFMNSTHDYWEAEIGSVNTSIGYVNPGRSPIYDQDRPVRSIGYLTHEFTERSIEFIQANKDRPFFLYLPYNAVHGPFQVPKDVYDKYAPLGYGMPLTLTRAMYDVLDQGVGRILDKLDELQLARNTLVIYAADNGGDPGKANWKLRGQKFTMMEGGIRVPTVMRWPARLPANRVYGHPITNLDYLPTMLTAAGGRLDGKFEGCNLLPYLSGEKSQAPHSVLYWKTGPRHYAVREGDWKLAYTPIGQGLFNLRDDPYELNDRRKDNPRMAARLEALFRDWDAHNAPPVYDLFLKTYGTPKVPHPEAGLRRYSPPFGGNQP